MENEPKRTPDLLKSPPRALHSTRVVAKFLGRTPQAVRVLIRHGVIGHVTREGPYYFVETRGIREYLDRRAQMFGEKKEKTP